MTSCLSCVDRHRTDRDAAWPALSAQVREVIGCADRPTVLATAALALGQLQRVIGGDVGSVDVDSLIVEIQKDADEGGS